MEKERAKIKQLQAEIKEAEKQEAVLKDRIETGTQQLKDEFDITVGEAPDLLDKLDEELDKLETEIKEKMEVFEEE